MKQITKRKKITISTEGPLRIKGGIRGPIEIPYMEEISVIGRMIMSGYRVFEHLSDGTKVRLDVHNYNKENGTNDMVVKYEPVKSATDLKKNKTASSTINNSRSQFNPLIDVYETK